MLVAITVFMIVIIIIIALFLQLYSVFHAYYITTISVSMVQARLGLLHLGRWLLSLATPFHYNYSDISVSVL